MALTVGDGQADHGEVGMIVIPALDRERRLSEVLGGRTLQRRRATTEDEEERDRAEERR